MKQINNKKEYQQGVALAILCSLLWGFLPIYWKSLVPVDPLLILFYRIVLSFLFAVILALILYKWEGVVQPLKRKGVILAFFIEGMLVSLNWGLYIWAVNNGHILQASIGYYIEPLLICVFGLLFFRERLNRYKLTAFLLACGGVAVMLIYRHQIPTIGLILAISFAAYTAIKKRWKLNAVLAQVYETMFIMPPALALIFYFEFTGNGAAVNAEPFQWALLALAGIMTCTPLMIFAMAANRISLVTLGITGYISPSISLILGVFIYHEPFDKTQFMTFAIIWAALAVFTAGEIIENRKLTYMTENKTYPAENRTEERFRFAGGIKRVTAGKGGEALLVTGSDKTALVDCGMAYCGNVLAENIKKELGERPLDYVILTHTHYDHIGGLPYLRKTWPCLISLGAEYGKKVLEKESALEQIKSLSEIGWEKFSEGKTKPDVLMEGLSIDRVVSEGDVISLGDREIRIYETPGHTNCSLTLLLEPDKILFPSETAGIYAGDSSMYTGMLKSFRETVASIEKSRKISADFIISPHFGQVPESDRAAYWDLAMETVNQNRDFILKEMRAGASYNEILKAYMKAFYVDHLTQGQPKEAFLSNARGMIKNLLKEFREYPGETI
ncbi:MAG TPA: EamA family transporter RarD [Anaerovoracaceae bacterium]|nr:EamA family transporter RarD [Anaerovoracaceae bacterium]